LSPIQLLLGFRGYGGIPGGSICGGCGRFTGAQPGRAVGKRGIPARRAGMVRGWIRVRPGPVRTEGGRSKGRVGGGGWVRRVGSGGGNPLCRLRKLECCCCSWGLWFS